MSTLILLRHGQSIWNRANLFTGWVDVPLSEQGIAEAQRAAEIMKDYSLDCVYVSTLVRSMMTAMIALNSRPVPPVVVHAEGIHQQWYEPTDKNFLPIYKAWQLNERYYGDLQGLNKADTVKRFGQEKVQEWRRSYGERPPNGESLEMTAQRTLPFFKKEILPKWQDQGQNILITAHGNSLRSILMYLEDLDEKEIVKLEVATGIPLIYSSDQKSWKREV